MALLCMVIAPVRAADDSGDKKDGGDKPPKDDNPPPTTDNPTPPAEPTPVEPTPTPTEPPNPSPTDPCHDNFTGNCDGGGGGGHHSHVSFTKKSGKRLVQIPSKATDFPDNDLNAIAVHVTSAKKDSIGDYHFIGEITNRGSDTLQFVQVTAHLFDANGQSVGVTTCCYATPTDIEPGHTSTFDSFAQKDQLSGKPVSFRLSFDWN